MSSLAPYMTTYKRKDGAITYAQQYPLKHLPKGSPSYIRIYKKPTADELTAEEQRYIRQTALAHYQEYWERRREHQVRRHAKTSHGVPRNAWSSLGDESQDSYWWEQLAASTRNQYRSHFNCIARELDGRLDYNPSTVTSRQIEQFVRRRGTPLGGVAMFIATFNRLLLTAKSVGLMPVTEVVHFSVIRPERQPIRIWETSDVSAACGMWEARGEPYLADLTLTGFITGQRLGDLRQMRFGKDYREGQLQFLTNKTSAPIRLNLPNGLRARLDERFKEGRLLFPTRKGRAWHADTLSSFSNNGLRAMAGYEDFPLKMRCLRHSAVVHFARAGCTIPQIASVTGHALVTVHQILAKYLPKDPILARQALALRAEREHAGPISLDAMMVEGDERLYVGNLPRLEKPTADHPQSYV